MSESDATSAFAVTETIVPTPNAQISPSISAQPMATIAIETTEVNAQNTTQWCRYTFTDTDKEKYASDLPPLLLDKFGASSLNNNEFEKNIAGYIKCPPDESKYICTYVEAYETQTGYYKFEVGQTIDIPINLITKKCKENGGDTFPPQPK